MWGYHLKLAYQFGLLWIFFLLKMWNACEKKSYRKLLYGVKKKKKVELFFLRQTLPKVKIALHNFYLHQFLLYETTYTFLRRPKNEFIYHVWRVGDEPFQSNVEYTRLYILFFDIFQSLKMISKHLPDIMYKIWCFFFISFVFINILIVPHINTLIHTHS